MRTETGVRQAGIATTRLEGAARGMGLAALIWLFLVSPLLMVWTQLPAIHPVAVVGEPGTLMARSLGMAVYRSMLSFVPSSCAALALGALVGALRVRGPMGFARPQTRTVCTAIVALGLNLAQAFTAISTHQELEASIGEAAKRVFAPAGPGSLCTLEIVCFAVFGAVLAGISTLGGRALTGWRRITLLAPALVVVVALATGLAPYGAIVAAGVLVGAALPLPAEQEATREPFVRYAATWSLASGAPAFLGLGLALGLGAVSQIRPLQDGVTLGAPTLIPELLFAGLMVGLLGLALSPRWLVRGGDWVSNLIPAFQAYRRLSASLRPDREESEMKVQGVPMPWVLGMVAVLVTLGVTASAMAYDHGMDRVQSTIRAQIKQQHEVIEVLIATRTLEPGVPIRPGDVILRGFSPELVPSDVYFASAEPVVGRSPTQRILANEIVRAERMGDLP